MARPQIVHDDATRFLNLMLEGEPATFQTFDDHGKRPELAKVLHGSFDALSPALRNLNGQGAGVFWMVNYGDGRGRRAANVTGVRCVFVDLDGAPLAPVQSSVLEPHAVVESSPGRYHVYWCMADCDPRDFKRVQQALAAKYGGDTSVCDLPRVMRLPGFEHRKGEPFTSRLLSLLPAQPYPVAEIVRKLALRPIPRESKASTAPVARASAAEHTVFAAGGRNNTLTKLAGQMRRNGLSPSAIESALLQTNSERCRPPLDAGEVRAIARSIGRYDPGQPDAAPEAEPPTWLEPLLPTAPPFPDEYTARARAGDDEAATPPFTPVPFADLAHAEPPAPLYWWDGYVPAGLVTLLSAHGGVGKSLVALMLAICVALGLQLFGVPTRRGRVLFFSAEDGPELMRYRLALVCKHLQVNAAALEGWLHILDASSGEPVLFREMSAHGQRLGVTTTAYAALVEFFETAQTDLLIVDNASDTFDAPEIQRALVRGFMRSLARIAQARGGAVLLLAHVDKATARGNATGSDSYSGSTAWHNSARSRIALTRTADGGLKLEHQKHNLGRLREPLELVWPEHGLPGELASVGPLTRRLVDQSDTRALLWLVNEFYARGEWVSTAPTAHTNAARLLAGQRGFPKRKPFEIFNLLREAERAGLIQREAWKDNDRKLRERWELTAAGVEFIGAAQPA